MENDKIFELLTRMNGEMNNRFDLLEKDMKEVKQDIGGLKQDIGGLKQDIGGLKQDVKKIYTKIEGDIDDKLRSLGDGYNINYDLTIEIRDKLEENCKNTENLTMALSEIKDDVNYLANKIIRQDGKINKLEKLDKEIRDKLNIAN